MMKSNQRLQPPLIFWLTILAALLCAMIAATGVFSQGGPGLSSFTNQYGQAVELYGRGIYAHDSALRASVQRGTDAVTLFLLIPTLLVAAWLDRRSPLKGRLFLTSLLAYFLYYTSSLAFGATFNALFLVYILAASISLFCFIAAFRSINLQQLGQSISPHMPYRWIGAFLFLAGLSTAVWLLDILAALSNRTVPLNLAVYHTEITYILDLGVILPSAWLGMILVWQRKPMGVLLALILTNLLLAVGLVVAGQSVVQFLEGIALSPAEAIAFVAPFITLSLVAAWLLIRIYRNIRPAGDL